MNKGRKHREAELTRLRSDASAVENMQIEYWNTPLPSSDGAFPAGSNAVDLFLQQWIQLIYSPTDGIPSKAHVPVSSAKDQFTSGRSEVATGTLLEMDVNPNARLAPRTEISQNGAGISQNARVSHSTNPVVPLDADLFERGQFEPSNQPAFQHTTPAFSEDLLSTQPTGAGVIPLLWTDDFFEPVDLVAFDNEMDLDSDMDWYNWVESAKGLEWSTDSRGLE